MCVDKLLDFCRLCNVNKADVANIPFMVELFNRYEKAVSFGGSFHLMPNGVITFRHNGKPADIGRSAGFIETINNAYIYVCFVNNRED